MTRTVYIWRLPRTTVNLGRRTAVMGILNVTPDSFSDGGLYFDPDRAADRGRQIEQDGADLLDIGGQSTRPGGMEVSEDEETRRVLPVIERLAAVLRIPISIDTYRSGVARRAMEAGAQIINDISGLRFDAKMPRVAQTTGAALALMHSRGDSATLHTQPKLEDPMREVLEGLKASIGRARSAGVAEAALVIDPGIGFGKDAAGSFKILKNLHEFSTLRCPILVGTSRKSLIRSVIGEGSEGRLWGTAATVAAAIMNGAHIVRVHDVREMRIVADVADRIVGS